MMEKVKHIFTALITQILRYFPVRHEIGLMKIGNPRPDSQIFITGNYYSTAKRVIKRLKGHDCYLLIVDSAGINVWCAAGVGDLNEHKIADAVNTYKLKDIVNHRTLIIPQLAAVGIDRNNLYKECGFKLKWGPANLDDIGEFIENNYEQTPMMRLVRFAFRDRVSLAMGQLFNYYAFFLYYFVGTIFFGSRYNNHALFVMLILFYTISASIFIFLMPFKWPASNVIFASIVPFSGILGYVFLINPSAMDMLPFYLISTAAVTLLICMDMVGSTVFYKSTVGHWLKTFNNRSLFQPRITKRCTKCGECVKVCPKGLLSKNGRGIVEVDLSNECCECLACVKQCHATAIENINKGIYKDDIKCIPEYVLSKVMF